jgi:hypothetical protein
MEANQEFCPQCGRAVVPSAQPVPAPGLEYELNSYAGKVRVLGILWLVYAGFALLTGLAGMAFLHTLLSGGFGPFAQGPLAQMRIFPMLARLALPLIVLRAILAVAAGWGLLERTEWGRIVALVAAVLCLLKIPFGTAMGIATLVILLGARNWALYERL